jgi:hypothetical protein
MTVLKDYFCGKRETACSYVLTNVLKNSGKNDRCSTLEWPCLYNDVCEFVPCCYTWCNGNYHVGVPLTQCK